MLVDNKIKEDDKYIIFHVEGGSGKQIASTAVLRAIKKQYPEYKIVVVCAWGDPYINNPNVFRFYLNNEMRYFKSDFVKDDTIIMKHDPYNETNHILGKEHLTETWCKLCGVAYDGYRPELYINPREIEIARDKIKPDGRPIMIMHTHGGSNQQYSKKSWYRDMPINIAQKLVNHYSKTYRILHVRYPEQLSLQNVEPLLLPLREQYATFMLSSKRLLIDSSCQHVCAALGLQSTVVWIGNKPSVFGYPENFNIMPNAKYINEFNKFTYLTEDISGNINSFPYDSVDLFDINEIISAVDRQK